MLNMLLVKQQSACVLPAPSASQLPAKACTHCHVTVSGILETYWLVRIGCTVSTVNSDKPVFIIITLQIIINAV